MKIREGLIYKNSDNEFYTPAQTGDFYIVDMWECNEHGEVKDIEENPYPSPINTSDLIEHGENKNNYEYPDFSPKF